ncbi:hypothetical protein JKP88DRAFT_273005 [Tribonema minus]|uniref:Uncharacterized protein n=1 Tax=Tribonema minus TaxID=303371 RepID=A0A835YX07_9STRA|nr:hypothetical protein JKP88DRAFT_273005 [Tribonema minus]
MSTGLGTVSAGNIVLSGANGQVNFLSSMATTPQIGVLSPLFDVSFAMNDAESEFASIATGGATVGRDPGADYVSLRVRDVGDRAVLQSRQYIPSAVGCTRIVTVVASLGSGGVGMRARVGAFDCADDRTDSPRGDGFFFEVCDGQSFVVKRSSAGGTSGTDLAIPQAQWNLDAADGSGMSRASFDPTQPNVFMIVQETAAGVGSVKMGVVVEGGVVYLHRFDNLPGVSPSRTSALPVRYEMENLSAVETVFEMRALSASVSSSGSVPRGTRRSVGLRAAAKDISVSSTSCPVVSVRLGEDTCRACARISALHLTCTTATYYELVLNGGLTGPEWVSAPAGKITQYDTTATDIVGGTVITSGYAGPNVTYDIDLDNGCVPSLAANIAGEADVYTLNVVCLMSSGLTWASVDVEEVA